jgi:hypothetical protein
MTSLPAEALAALRAHASRIASDESLAAFISSSRGAVEAYAAATAKGAAAFAVGPAEATFGLCLFAAFSSWQLNLTGWWSAVDRCWSVLPVAYALIFALWPQLGPLLSGANGGAAAAGVDARLALMAALVTLWGARLTYNFWRKGGYAPGMESEDYRWPKLRAFFRAHDPTHPLGEHLFSLFFVAIYQHLLIWLFVVPPLFVAARSGAGAPLGVADALLAVAFLTLLAGETWADEAQWVFQEAKHAMTPAQRERAGGDFARGFLTTGPFAISRHLNFFCEQSMWLVFYAFSWAAGAHAANWSAVGALLLVGLFQGSTWMTERELRARAIGSACSMRLAAPLKFPRLHLTGPALSHSLLPTQSSPLVSTRSTRRTSARRAAWCRGSRALRSTRPRASWRCATLPAPQAAAWCQSQQPQASVARA